MELKIGQIYIISPNLSRFDIEEDKGYYLGESRLLISSGGKPKVILLNGEYSLLVEENIVLGMNNEELGFLNDAEKQFAEKILKEKLLNKLEKKVVA